MNLKYLFAKAVKKAHLPAVADSKIDRKAKVCSGCNCKNIEVGRYSYIGNFSTIVNTTIGAFCSVADNCIIGGAAHPIDWASTSPVFYDIKNCFDVHFSNNVFLPTKKTVIGNDVWIGNNCLIKSGVTIGDGAVIGMGSVVPHDVPPYSVVVGNPAKWIKKRFDDETVEFLLRLKWWDWSEDKLRKLGASFNDVEALKKIATER